MGGEYRTAVGIVEMRVVVEMVVMKIMSGASSWLVSDGSRNEGMVLTDDGGTAEGVCS